MENEKQDPKGQAKEFQMQLPGNVSSQQDPRADKTIERQKIIEEPDHSEFNDFENILFEDKAPE